MRAALNPRMSAIDWLTFEHNSLDARLGAVLMKAVWGPARDAADELTKYGHECAQHVERAEPLLFRPLAGIDGRMLGVEKREWRVHVADLEQAVRIAQSALQSSSPSAFAAFGILRQAMRRHRADERRLLDLAEELEDAPAGAFQ
jgi:hypothetical protein